MKNMNLRIVNEEVWVIFSRPVAIKAILRGCKDVYAIYRDNDIRPVKNLEDLADHINKNATIGVKA
jgi:hypothetical protein